MQNLSCLSLSFINPCIITVHDPDTDTQPFFSLSLSLSFKEKQDPSSSSVQLRNEIQVKGHKHQTLQRETPMFVKMLFRKCANVYGSGFYTHTQTHSFTMRIVMVHFYSDMFLFFLLSSGDPRLQQRAVDSRNRQKVCFIFFSKSL